MGTLALLGGCATLDPSRFLSKGSVQAAGEPLWMIVHRVNTPARAAAVGQLAQEHADLTLRGRPVRWGIEVDVQAVDEQVLVNHRRATRNASRLADIVAQLPEHLMTVLELKPSMRQAGAIASMRQQLAGYRQPRVFASFDHQLLAQAAIETSSPTALMTWQLGQGGNGLLRLAEKLMRVSGVWSAFPSAPLSIAIAAYPWQQATPELVDALRTKGVDTLCGSVDSNEALAHVATIPAMGLFTDTPERLIDYMRQHP